MLILFCITRSDTLGGAHIHVADLAAWIRSIGHDAVVVVGGEGPYCDYLESKGVPYLSCRHLIRPIKLVDDIRAIYELRRIMQSMKPDLIALHSAKAGLLGRVAAVGMESPVVFTAHGWSFTEGISAPRARVFRALEGLMSPLADKIITVSEYDRQLALSSGVAPEEKLITIHNGMPDVNMRANTRDVLGPVRLIMVARFDAPKDHSALFAALARVKDRDWVLDLVGDGPNESHVKAEASQLGISSRVRFLGRRTDVADLLAKAHLFVLTTHWEGFPCTILEAMRAGLPVIATKVGGIPESVQDGITGYLVPDLDINLLHARLAYLLDYPEERARLGVAGRKRFEKYFLFENMAVATWNVYRNLVGEGACTSV